jgi:hypothetical protein
MRDLPDIAVLLALVDTADDALAQRCRAIAAREHQQGREPYDRLRARLVALQGDDDLVHLAHDILAGRCDGRDEIRQWLWDFTVQRLSENNPALLEE